MAENCDFLAWFLGPKAEQGALFEELLTTVLRDYLHWRRNYFPGDRTLIDRQRIRGFEVEHDRFHQKVLDMQRELRRNFPFYSPRYVAHMLSDQLLPAQIGYIAGMLFNPNNVTPEAAPVTVDFEVDACDAILRMLGFTPPPPLPGPEVDDPDSYYVNASQQGFGWGHITAGGTTANIEALWVARNVRYFPLAVRDAALENDLEVILIRAYNV